MTALILSILLASWGPMGCGSVEPMRSKLTPVGYEWRPREGIQYLYKDNQQVGAFDEKRDVFRTYDPEKQTWGPEQAPPWKDKELVGQNFGLDRERISKEERCTLNGKAIPKQQALQALGGFGVQGDIPDDASKPFLVIIGKEDERKPFFADWVRSPELAPYRDKFRVQAFDPNDWALKDRDGKPTFQTTGTPTIYVQNVDGNVLHRQDSYDGPESLATALRKSTEYDPKKDVDLRKLIPELPQWVWLVGGGIVLLLLTKKVI